MERAAGRASGAAVLRETLFEPARDLGRGGASEGNHDQVARLERSRFHERRRAFDEGKCLARSRAGIHQMRSYKRCIDNALLLRRRLHE